MMPNNDMPEDKGDEKTSDRDALIAKIVEKLQAATDEDLKEMADSLDKKDPNAEPAESEIPKVIKPAGPVVDTATLTGPRSALKNMLMKKSMDNSEAI